jgi:uncharacterized membrane protein YgcG
VPPQEDQPDAAADGTEVDPSPAGNVTDPSDRPVRAGFLARLRRDMTRNEQLVVYLGAVLALGVNLFVAVSPSTVTHGSKSAHVSTPVVAIIGVAGFLVLAAVARYGRRTVAAIAALLVSFVTAQPLGYAYIALGAWLFYKGTRAQRERMTAERGSASGSRAAGTRGGVDRTATRSGGGRSASRWRRSQPEPPSRPASKRYTPPGTRGRRR